MPPARYGQTDPRHLARLLAAMVPDEVAKSITSAEYNDRIVEAARLGAQANDLALSPALRQAAKLRSQAVLRAQPRAITERQHGELIAKAATVRNPFQADAIRRQADRLLEEQQPVAPRRGTDARLDAIRQAHRGRVPVGKAKADKEPPVPVFDADGNLVGVVEADAIQPVTGAGKKTDAPPAPAPAQPAGHAAAPAQPVAKAIKALGPEWTGVHDYAGALVGAVRRSNITRELPPGRVAKSQMAESHANVYDASRRKVGMARLTDIIPMAALRAVSEAGQPRRQAGR